VIAYVDESVRLTGDGRYVLAAVTVPPARAAEVRAALVSSLRRGQRRFHWHDENAPGRLAMAGLVASLALDAVVVTVTPVTTRDAERARRRCLRRLLWELDQRGVREVLFESRQRRDAKDRAVLGHLHRSGWAGAELRYAFTPPQQEPLLWVADVVAGAVAAAGDGDGSFLALLGDRTFVVAES
jgi:hypothetical protein